jgi:hypothetical protein
MPYKKKKLSKSVKVITGLAVNPIKKSHLKPQGLSNPHKQVNKQGITHPHKVSKK